MDIQYLFHDFLLVVDHFTRTTYISLFGSNFLLSAGRAAEGEREQPWLRHD